METKFEKCWAILELFGHTKTAGEISEQQIAGANFVRIDVPAESGAHTRFYNPSAIYGITPVSEEIARELAQRHAPQPVQRFELRNLLPSAPARRVIERDDDEMEF